MLDCNLPDGQAFTVDQAVDNHRSADILQTPVIAELIKRFVKRNLLDSKLAREDSPARARRTALMLAHDLTHEEADRILAQEGRISAKERKYV